MSNTHIIVTPADKPTKFRWVVIGLLFFICINNYIDRSAISYAITPIITEFGLSPIQVGMILSGFGIGYACTTLLGGILVDRYGSRMTLIIFTLFWSFAIGLTGFAINFTMLYVLRIFLGLAEGPNYPAATRVISDWLPASERVAALSWVLIAVPLALAIGAPFVTQLIIHISWRGMFLFLALIGFLWIPVWWYLYRDSSEQSRFTNSAERQYITGHPAPDEARDLVAKKQNSKELWKFLFTNSTLLANYWAFLVFGYFLFFFMNWLPTYLEQAYHLNLKQVGLFSIVPWLLAAVLLGVVGYFSDYLFIKTGRLRYARTYIIAGSQFLAAISVIPIIYTHNITFAITCISLAVGFSMSANAPFYAVNVDIIKARAGTALGVMDTTFALAGFGASALTGIVVEKTGSFNAAFGLLLILALSSVIILLLFHRPDTCQKWQS